MAHQGSANTLFFLISTMAWGSLWPGAQYGLALIVLVHFVSIVK